MHILHGWPARRSYQRQKHEWRPTLCGAVRDWYSNTYDVVKVLPFITALTFIDDLNEEIDPRMQYVSADELGEILIAGCYVKSRLASFQKARVRNDGYSELVVPRNRT